MKVCYVMCSFPHVAKETLKVKINDVPQIVYIVVVFKLCKSAKNKRFIYFIYYFAKD